MYLLVLGFWQVPSPKAERNEILNHVVFYSTQSDAYVLAVCKSTLLLQQFVPVYVGTPAPDVRAVSHFNFARLPFNLTSRRTHIQRRSVYLASRAAYNYPCL